MTVPQAQDAHAAALDAIEKALKRAGAREGYTVPVLATTVLGPVVRHDAPHTPFKEYHEQDALDALALLRSRLVVLEQERAAAWEVLEWLISLDDPEDVIAREERREVTLTKIIRRARRAVSVADIPQEDTE